jgi:hypothetical protein
LKKLGPKIDLSQIPLTDNESNCKKCSFKPMCPARDGLEQSKLEQQAMEYNYAKMIFESK